METTYEQRRAVARDECRMGGHVIQTIMAVGSLDPQALVCERCGTSWTVTLENDMLEGRIQR
jgi:hypothetical protein